MRALRIVAIAPYVPYRGIDHAGGAFLFEYLTALSEHSQVLLAAPASETNAVHYSDSPVHAHLIPLDHRSPLLVRKVDAFLRAPSPGRDFVRAFQRNDALAHALDEADVVELHWGYLLALVPWLRRRWRGLPVAVHGHDVIWQGTRRRAAARRNPISRYAECLHAEGISVRERRYLDACAVGYYFSPDDVRLLRDSGVRIPLRVIHPNLLIPELELSATARQPTEVLFVGALQRTENSDGVRWFLEHVWPRVQTRVPDARFVIAGANPPAELLAACPDSVSVTGYVEDLQPFYRSAAVFVAPLLTGAGLKFKIAQALLFGLPVVTTNIGAEGFTGPLGQHLFAAVTDSPAEMADAVADLLLDESLRARYGERGREYALSRFSFRAGIETVLRDYSTLRDKGELV